MKLFLYSAYDVQTHLADAVQQQRKALHGLDKPLPSVVPASTMKKFETTVPMLQRA